METVVEKRSRSKLKKLHQIAERAMMRSFIGALAQLPHASALTRNRRGGMTVAHVVTHGAEPELL
jgi:hypothetical protein